MVGRLIRPTLATVALAACAYFAAVFLAGFILGSIRVLAVAPLVGELPAVLIELPIMLLVSWLVSGAIMRRLAVRGRRAALVMGFAAFALLMSAEVALAVVGLGSSVAEVLGRYAQPAGLAGLAGQVAFAFTPLLRSRP